jgi:transcriptional regulator with PAS, ATPase and Fis domain
LRVIETNEVYPLGADSAEHVELRYVAATHRDLDELVGRGEFRQDLLQRLAGNVIRIAPLRERPGDIVDIGLGFMDGYGQGSDPDGRIRAWLSSAEARQYAWPGNVRELQNALRNLLLGLPPGVDRHAEPRELGTLRGEAMPAAIAGCTASLQAVSDWYMRRVLAHVAGNHSQAAKILAVDRSTVRRRAEARKTRRRR